MKKVKIAAGLCNADYGHIGDQVAAATEAGVDIIHAEAADMYVLPDHPLMGGPQVVEGIRPRTHLPIEMHCYIRECSELFIDITADAGANRIILPLEYFLGGAPLAYFIKRAREKGMEFGLMLDCVTPARFIEEAIYWVDRVHVVTHDIDEENWGWRRSQISMIRKLRKMIDELKPGVELACDGGISAETLEPLVEAGADVLEFSSPIFRTPRPEYKPATKMQIIKNVIKIRKAIDKATKKAFKE
ncbi:MAG TPA: pentose-5-phosphate 3-epimerase [Anaerolineae bacterium]|nr:pentose-5-phosphate 3-epimerase [Anaerolineae bacterium]